jgi:hypothetical protein
MSKISTLLSALSLGVLLGAAACADEGSSCEDGQCVVVRDPGGKDDDPGQCIEACKNLMGECDGAANVASELDGCTRHCRAEFSEAEAACLAALTCGDEADGCLD